MKTEYFPVATDNLQSFVETEKLLVAEIESLLLKLKETKSVKKHTQEVLGAIKSLDAKIERDRQILEEIELMRALSPGQWVRNGSTKPGEIIELKVSGRIPEVWVKWWNDTAPVPESPRRLSSISPEQLDYIWNGEQYPKLIRVIDRFECEDISLLQKKITELNAEKVTEFSTRQIVYCKKRIELLTARDQRSKQENLLSRLYGKEKADPKILKLALKEIKTDPSCQQREQLDEETLKDYLDIWLSGGVLPPVKVIQDGSNYWLYDGFHTLASARNARIGELNAEVTSGTLRDAILASVGVNASHGLRRSNQTKRNAVMTLLRDKEWGKWSNVQIAKACSVSEYLVREIKKSNPNFETDEIICKDKYGSTMKMNVKNIKDTNSTNGRILKNDVSKDTNSTKDHFDSIEVSGAYKLLGKPQETAPCKDTNSTDSHLLKNEVSGAYKLLGKPQETAPCKDTNSTDGHYDSIAVDKDNGHREAPLVANQGACPPNFQVDDLVVIDSNRADKKLIGYYGSKAIITEVFENSVNLKIWNKRIENVSFYDIKKVNEKVNVLAFVDPKILARLMNEYDSIEEFILTNLNAKRQLQPVDSYLGTPNCSS